MRIRLLAFVIAATLAPAPRAFAQQQPPSADTGTGALQARVRQRLAAVVKQRLNLTDDQMRQLASVNASYEGRRRALMAQEHDARVVVRGELQRGKLADQQRVDSALTELFRVQRARIDLAEQEQRDLSKFMQPSQRAGYLALQEQVRRRVEQMRRRRQNPRG
jgi:hypothetical protein